LEGLKIVIHSWKPTDSPVAPSAKVHVVAGVTPSLASPVCHPLPAYPEISATSVRLTSSDCTTAEPCTPCPATNASLGTCRLSRCRAPNVYVRRTPAPLARMYVTRACTATSCGL